MPAIENEQDHRWDFHSFGIFGHCCWNFNVVLVSKDISTNVGKGKKLYTIYSLFITCHQIRVVFILSISVQISLTRVEFSYHFELYFP